MANTFFPFFRQIADYWNSALGDSNFTALNEFKHGGSVQSTWHVKFLRNEKDQLNNRYLALEKRFNEAPEVTDLASDNILRLTLLSGVERVIALRQAYSVLKNRFFLPVNSTGTFNEIANQGFRNGYFKGAILNATQFLGIHYNTLLWARGDSFISQLFFSSAFETLFHPIDTVKTLLYADTQGAYKGAFDCLGKVVQEQGVAHLFRGLTFRLIYNSAFLLHLRNLYEDNGAQYITTPLWLLSYGFLAIKTRLQVAGTALSYQNAVDLAAKGAEKGLYRGLLPFALVNLLATYQVYGYYSQTAQDQQVDSLRTQLRENFSSPLPENRWA